MEAKKLQLEDNLEGPREVARPAAVAAGVPSFDEARADFTRAYLRQVLQLAGGNISRAARIAGRNRTDLYKLMHRHGIRPAEFKGAARNEAPAS